MDTDCIFCKILTGDIPSLKVYEDESTYAFLDIHPVNTGHILVIPKRHSRNILDISDEDLASLTATAKKAAQALISTGAEGVNIITNNEKPAGQVVFHTHWHIVPRYEGDGFTHWRGTARSEEEMEAKRQELEKKLQDMHRAA
ncbi:HIT family protein [Candidatus Parcubacteria bacterium]|nr:HIT family protein [Candidatus Parcubacteria bacterium]